MILEARDLSVVPPGATAPTARGLSLSVARGEWVAVTGPNGGGKTSLLLGMAGLWPASGELRLDGRAFGPHSDPGARRRLGVVLQDPSSQILQPTVADELAFGPRNAGVPDAEVHRRVEYWGRMLGLSADLARDPARLSAGRQQLVLIGGALANQPDILLADEATAHLDPTARRRVLATIAERVAAGMAVVWVTQLEEEVAAAHRVVELGHGRSPSPAVRNAARPGPPALTIVVDATPEAEGPRVVVERPMCIEVGDRGVTGLVGPNGSGKSVLLWAAAGLGHPDQLHINWVTPPVSPPIAALQFPEMQIFEEAPLDEACYAAVARGMGRAAAEELARKRLQDLDLDPASLSRTRTWGLAAGEKRILEVVAALIAPASLFVLDEPTAGLDPARRAALGRLVSEIAAEKPVLIASQDREWLEGVATRTWDLGSGSETPVKGLT